MTFDASSYVQLGSVRIGVDGVAEMDEERPLVSVPRAEVERLEGLYGPGGERPLLSLILGIALLGVAVIPVLMLIDVLRRGGTYYVEWIAAVACVIPGLWLIDLGARRRWLLVVTTRRGRRKLLFPRKASQTEVESFVAGARARFGYG